MNRAYTEVSAGGSVIAHARGDASEGGGGTCYRYQSVWGFSNVWFSLIDLTTSQKLSNLPLISRFFKILLITP